MLLHEVESRVWSTNDTPSSAPSTHSYTAFSTDLPLSSHGHDNSGTHTAHLIICTEDAYSKILLSAQTIRKEDGVSKRRNAWNSGSLTVSPISPASDLNALVETFSPQHGGIHRVSRLVAKTSLRWCGQGNIVEQPRLGAGGAM